MVDGHTKLHQTEHQAGGIDEIPQGSLLPQDPTAHQADHVLGGPDAISGLDATQIGDGRVTNGEYYMLDGVNTASELVTKDQLDSAVQGLDWQESVLSMHDPNNGIPTDPSEGDRYLSTGTANGWNADSIYEWDGSSWIETVPDEGFVTVVEDENQWYAYDGSVWSEWGTMVDHGNLVGLQDDDHTQYLLHDGSRAMSGHLDMNGNYILNIMNAQPASAMSNIGNISEAFGSVFTNRLRSEQGSDLYIRCGFDTEKIMVTNAAEFKIDGTKLVSNDVIDFTAGVLKPKVITQDAEPSLTSGEFAVWEDDIDGHNWLLLNIGGNQYRVELA
ncbi:MAG: DUF2793 domain-containing protein [Thermoplasmata archaeon]